MARIRTIKPDYWTDERVGQCSIAARLLFIASWNFADDHGAIGRSAKQLKAQAFPYDAIDCEPLIQELLEAGLVVEYAVEGKTYLHINGFRKHQRQDNVAAPRFPLYRDESRVLASSSESVREVASNGDDSHGSRGNSALLLEGKGSTTAVRKRPTVVYPPEFEEIQHMYPHRGGAQPWHRAFKAARARLADGSSWAELAAGVRRYAAFIQMTRKEGTEFVMQAATFFGPERHFTEAWDPPPPIPQSQTQGKWV